MSSLNLIGGEKGGVGKSVVARLLAQYWIDAGRPFVGFDADRSHPSFTRFYADFASPVIIDSYESLDRLASVFEHDDPATPAPSVIVDLAAQTAAPLARWMQESALLEVLGGLGVGVNLWHVADAGHDSVELLQKLIDLHGAGPRYFVVRNFGRGSDFSQLDASPALQQALDLGARIVSLPALHEATMRKIDRQNASFWAALNSRGGPDALGLLERQRLKLWLKSAYEVLDSLPVG